MLAVSFNAHDAAAAWKVACTCRCWWFFSNHDGRDFSLALLQDVVLFKSGFEAHVRQQERNIPPISPWIHSWAPMQDCKVKQVRSGPDRDQLGVCQVMFPRILPRLG